MTNILALSTYDDPGYVQGMLEAGAVGYLLKDEAPARIVEAVRAAGQGEGWFSPKIAVQVAAWARGEQPNRYGLTEREVEVLRLLVAGKGNKEMAKALGISEKPMKHLQSPHRIVYILGALLFIAALVIPGLKNVSADGNPQLLKSGDFAGWRYNAMRQPDGQLMAAVDYDQLSTAGLEQYAIANKDLPRQLPKNGRLAVSVTFRYPLTIDAFQNWVSSNGMIVEAYTLRATIAVGEKWTIGGKPDGATLVPLDSLNRQLAAIRAYGEAKLDGVVGVDGIINAANVVSLQAEREVFLVDLTTAFVRQELQPLLGQASDQVQVVRPPVYWFMEKYGLQNTSF